MKTLVRFTIALALLTLTLVMGAGCQNSSGKGSPKEGSSSGGGGFGDESSLTILHWAAEDLAKQIEQSSPGIYAKLPEGWTQARLAQVIRAVKPTKSGDDRAPEVERYGLRLMFDYDKAAGYITATQLFLDAYSSFEVNSRSKASFFATLEEVKLRLAHEAAHLMGLGETKETDTSEARAFAHALLKALDRDNLECVPVGRPPASAFTEKQKIAATPQALDDVQGLSLAYVIHIPSGRGMVLSNASPDNKDGVTLLLDRHRFDFDVVSRRVRQNFNGLGSEDGTFSWDAVDQRKAVLTDRGFRSEYKYDDQGIDTHLDFRQLKNEGQLVFESYPKEMQDNPLFRSSDGRLRITVGTNADGRIQAAALIHVPSGEGTPEHMELICRRSARVLQ